MVIAGALLEACDNLLNKGIHPSQISDSFQIALNKSLLFLEAMAKPVDLSERQKIISCVNTALASKVVSNYSTQLSPIAVDAVLKVFLCFVKIIDIKTSENVDLKDIKIVKKLGGTIDDTCLVDGLVFTQSKVSHSAGGPSRIQNPKIALLQFCLSPPKTDIEN